MYASNLSLGILGNAFSRTPTVTGWIFRAHPHRSPTPLCACKTVISPPVIVLNRESPRILAQMERNARPSGPATPALSIFLNALFVFHCIFLPTENTGASQSGERKSSGGLWDLCCGRCLSDQPNTNIRFHGGEREEDASPAARWAAQPSYSWAASFIPKVLGSKLVGCFSFFFFLMQPDYINVFNHCDSVCWLQLLNQRGSHACTCSDFTTGEGEQV